MKKEYMKPSMEVILQHTTRLLAGSGEVSDVQTTGWDDPADELIISDQGGSSSILDR